jgi:hypothetical protein
MRVSCSRLYLFVTAACLLAATCAGAYGYFGKNKVQRYDYEWRTLKSERIELYYYPEEEPLAERTMAWAEEAFTELAERMQYTPGRKVPIILYSSHGEFEETNILPYILPESVGGFTEIFKNRVVLPFEGSYPQLRHVLWHEMTHFFLFEKLRYIYHTYHKYDYGAPPFWYVEGIAEYMSTEWDSTADMVLADALYSDAFVPLADGNRMAGTYLGYKEGEAALRYIAEKYGEDKIIDVLNYAWVNYRYKEVLAAALPVPLEELDREWKVYLSKRYWPRFAELEPYEVFAEKANENHGFRTGIAWLDSDRLVYLSDDEGYSSVYLMEFDEWDNVSDVRKLVVGERTPTFEVLHVFRGRVGTYGRKLVAFVARSGPADSVYVYDVDNKGIVDEYVVPGAVTLSSPAFSADGTKIAVQGIRREGKSDLYVIDRGTGETALLTDDLYDDRYPTWWGDRVVFASDRPGQLDKPYYNLYAVDTATGEVTRLTYGEHMDFYPVYSPDEDRIYYTSDRAGLFDVYRLDLNTGYTERMTKAITGVVEAAPRPGAGPGKVAFVAMSEQSYNVYTAALEPVEGVDTSGTFVAAGGAGLPERPSVDTSKFESTKYSPDFALDFFNAEIAYGPEYGTQTGVVLVFTDMLNDHYISVAFGNNATEIDEFLARTSVGVNYFNLHHRLGYGLGGFRYVDEYYEHGLDTEYTEWKTGGGTSMSYPLNRYNRIGTDILIYRRKLLNEYSGKVEDNGTKVSSYASFTHDTSLWYQEGPIDGARINLTAGETADIGDAANDYFYFGADMRFYLRTTLTQCFAARALYQSNNGPQARPMYMGGSLSVRGYKFFDFTGRKLGLFNLEYRFPILNPFPLRTAIGSITIPALRGALLFDAGNAWDRKFSPGQFRGSFGLGLRMTLGGFLTLRTDHVFLTDFDGIGPFVPIRFFVGWSY